MPRLVAFLRGINVGGHRVSMDRLRSLFTELGFGNVETFIASGNVIFDSKEKPTAKLEAKIEQHLEDALGWPADTFLRGIPEVALALKQVPFPPSENETVQIVFLRKPLGPAGQKAIASFETDVDEFRVVGREMYWRIRGKVMDSQVKWPALTKAIGMSSTARNQTSVRKLLDTLTE